MLPQINDEARSEEEIKERRRSQQIRKEPKNENTIIMEGPISKFMNKHSNLVKRYLVLNSLGLFVYKDDIGFRSFPHKPAVVIPLNQIASINQREFAAH